MCLRPADAEQHLGRGVRDGSASRFAGQALVGGQVDVAALVIESLGD